MMYWFLATLFFGLWYVADKQLKQRFNPYLKWGALAMIFLFVFFDGFMFLETERLINAHECCSNCADNSTGECEQCCISYISNSMCGNLSEIVIAGTQTTGNNKSLLERDDDIVTIMLNMQKPIYIMDVNISCPSNTLMFKGKSDTDTNEISIYNGSSWITIYTFGNSTEYYEQIIDISAYQYIFNNTMRFRVESKDDGSQSTMFAYFDQLNTVTPVTHKMYCDDTGDTAAIMAYHYIEYPIIVVIMDLLPFLAIFVVLVFGYQILTIMYDNALNPRGEADDVIGTDNSTRERVLKERDRQLNR
jgi:hypothetical protein